MVHLIQPGSAYLCTVNSHRDGWNGVICSDPVNWNCGADERFRMDACAQGIPKCFQLDLFNQETPRLQVDGNGCSWFLEDVPEALDDQFIVLSGQRSTEPRGVPEVFAGSSSEIIMGIYRVKSVVSERRGFQTIYTVTPHRDGWVRLEEAQQPKPAWDRFGGKYMVEIESGDIRRCLDTIANRNFVFKDSADRKRFEHFRAKFPEWQAAARKAMSGLATRHDVETANYGSEESGTIHAAPNRALLSSSLGSDTSFAEIQAKISQRKASREASSAAQPAPPADPKSPPVTRAIGGLPEAERRPWVARTYGADTLLELDIAAATRSIVILRGDPGVGKSHLAFNLLDDQDQERTLALPVPATWRGREDLLGYINPIHGTFQRTAFTEFLSRAADAWESGDRRTRIVVFEEFNLSQPEHWFSDILSISQIEDESRRWIDLGATTPGNPKAAPGLQGKGASAGTEIERLFLSPAVRFIGTINSDHTTRALSPRVLDRSAVITLELGVKAALSRADLALDEDVMRSITTLDHLLKSRGCAFSIRTAMAVKAAGETLKERPTAEIVDAVLKAQILSKVRIMAHDRSDEQLLRALEAWASDPEMAPMPRCELVITTWRERLNLGVDVIQA